MRQNFVEKVENVKRITAKRNNNRKVITAISFYIAVIYILPWRKRSRIFITKICNSNLCGLIFYTDTAGDQRPLRMIDQRDIPAILGEIFAQTPLRCGNPSASHIDAVFIAVISCGRILRSLNAPQRRRVHVTLPESVSPIRPDKGATPPSRYTGRGMNCVRKQRQRDFHE